MEIYGFFFSFLTVSTQIFFFKGLLVAISLGKLEIFSFISLFQDYKLLILNFFIERQLGTEDFEDHLENPILSIKDKKIVSVCCGIEHSVILLEDGQILGFGAVKGLGMANNHSGSEILEPSLLMKDNTIKRISCGDYFTLVQTMNGDVFHFEGEEGQNSIVNENLVMKNPSIKFIQQRNFIEEWKPENHQNCCKQFKEIVLNLLLCLKIQGIKVPKFVFFIIVRQIYQNY